MSKITASIRKLFLLLVIFLQWANQSDGFVILPRTNGVLSNTNFRRVDVSDSSIIPLNSKWKRCFEIKSIKNQSLRKKVLCRMSAVSSNQERQKSISETKPPRRNPKSQKIAIRWVVESISKEMNKECDQYEKLNGKKKQPNFRLLEALTDLFKGKF